MAIVPVNHTIAVGTDPTTIQSTGISTIGATFAVVITTYLSSGTPPTISDDFSSVWNDLTAYTCPTVHATIRISYATLAGTGAAHKFQAQGLNCYPVIAPLVFSGVAATPFDQQNGSALEAANANSVQANGGITPTQNNELVIFGAAWDTRTGVGSVSAPYTITDQVDFPVSGGTNLGTGAAYNIQTTATATNPTWTYGGTVNDVAAAIASFKAAAAAPAAGVHTPHPELVGIYGWTP